MKHNINVKSEVLAFECRLFQSIWIFQSGDIAMFSMRSQETNCVTFRECDTKITTFVDIFIDLDEFNSIGEEMCKNHNSTFASDSSVAHGCTLIK